MNLRKITAIVIPGSTLAGGLALTMGAATPASATVVMAAPQRLFPQDGCCSRGGSRLSHRNFNVNRHNQRIVINSRTIVTNVSKSDSDAKQRQQVENQNSPAASSSSSAAAAGGGGGGGGGGGDTGRGGDTG